MKRIVPIAILLFLLPLYLFSLSTVALQRKALSANTDEVSYVLPPALLKITSLEFDGLAADFLFLKALGFFGGTFARTERPRVKEAEWRWMFNVLDAATELDPWFYDPYYFANCNFTWEANKAKEANTLLAKGSRARDWDWTIPFYMGFNEFYFLHDNAKASEYLMQGARRPDADPILSTLAVRLAYKASRSEVAIIFLRETMDKTKDKITRRELELNLKSLEGVYSLEQAVNSFTTRFGRQPATIDELLSRGIIGRLPEDPYHGKYYIDKDGSVKATSDMRPH
jgi:hypothetical protein